MKVKLLAFSTNIRVNPYEAAANYRSPWITVDGIGVVYIAYTKINSTSQNIFITKSLDGGSSYKVPVKVNDDSLNCYRGKKEIAVSEDGKIYVVWTDGRHLMDIYSATSSDGGVTFGANVRVNDDADISYPQDIHGTPSLVLDRTGGIHVVWEDFRNDGVTPAYFRDVYYAFSEDGKRFSENVKVNYVPDATSVDCADPNMAIDSQDNLYIVFSDAPHNDADLGIYFAYSAGWTWPMFHHDLTHSGYSTSTAPNTNQTLWNCTTGGPVWSSPAVVGGLVYVGSYDRNVYCLNATTGALVWNYTTGNWVLSSPVVADGFVYVGSADNSTYCLNATTGAFVWSYKTGNWVCSSPAVVGGLVYVGSDDNNVYCLNATTGALVWNHTTGYWVYSSPAVASGLVYVGSYDRNVYCLNATTGALVWNYTTGAYVYSSPVVADGFVYVGSADNSTYCLNATTGAFVWNYTTGNSVSSSPAVVGGLVYVGSDDNNVYCLNATTGAFVWSYKTGNWIEVSSPAVVDGVVYVGSFDGKIYAFGSIHDVEVTNVVSSKAVIGKGYSLNANVTAANQGNNAETFNVTAYANATIIASENVTLPAGNSTTVTFTWNTYGFAYGNYTIGAYAQPVPGETNTANNNFTNGIVTVTIPGDINGDFKVTLVDLVLLANAYGSTPQMPSKWNPNADINGNGVVDLTDLVLLAVHYGQHYP